MFLSIFTYKIFAIEGFTNLLRERRYGAEGKNVEGSPIGCALRTISALLLLLLSKIEGLDNLYISLRNNEGATIALFGLTVSSVAAHGLNQNGSSMLRSDTEVLSI